jgi:hypothetical protein
MCPACDAKTSALNTTTHCTNKACIWVKCKCGVVYDREAGTGFGVGVFYTAA